MPSALATALYAPIGSPDGYRAGRCATAAYRSDLSAIWTGEKMVLWGCPDAQRCTADNAKRRRPLRSRRGSVDVDDLGRCPAAAMVAFGAMDREGHRRDGAVGGRQDARDPCCITRSATYHEPRGSPTDSAHEPEARPHVVSRL